MKERQATAIALVKAIELATEALPEGSSNLHHLSCGLQSATVDNDAVGYGAGHMCVAEAVVAGRTLERVTTEGYRPLRGASAMVAVHAVVCIHE